MRIIRFADFETYGKAIAFLLRRGAMVEARDEWDLIVTPAQQEALIEAGIIQPTNGSPRTKKRASKAKRTDEATKKRNLDQRI